VESKGKDIEALNSVFEEWQKIIALIKVQVPPIFEKLKESLKPIIEVIIEAQKTVQKAFIAIPPELWATLIESLQKLPSRVQEALLLLGNHGWYLDKEMSLPDLWELTHTLSEGNIAEAEAWLTEYYEKKLNAMEDSISKRYPAREKFIKASFGAHRREEYELSIPVLLAQADGICKEVTGHYFFRKEGRKQDRRPSTAIYVEQITSDTIMKAFLRPLAQTLPIGASERERDVDFDQLNRHMVLHGDDLEYDTKTNSLKAISFINYVAHAFERIR